MLVIYRLRVIDHSPETAAGIIKTEISNWAIDWLVRFNTNKTISMLISRKLIQVNPPPLQMDRSILTEKQSHKHFDITFSKSWTERVDNISKKAWVRLNLLRSFKLRVSRNALEKMYISFIHFWNIVMMSGTTPQPNQEVRCHRYRSRHNSFWCYYIWQNIRASCSRSKRAGGY